MAGPIRISILANASQARRELNGIAGETDSLGAKFRKFGKVAAKAAAAGLAVAGAAAVKFGVDSVKAASDAEQSLGAVEQIFGKYADTVVKRSNQAANAIGLSANEYRELSSVTGAMLKSSGMPLQRVTDLTDKLNRRAADLAATFGGTTKDAVEAVSSLLRGEADPIEKYGVSIKQSDVNARLAAKGLNKLTGSARKTAEQQARLDLLFEQSKDSAGQFARESDTLAGKQQRLAAKIENVKARIGKALMPAVLALADIAEKRVVPALEKFATWVEKNSDEIAAFGNGIGNALLPPLKTLGEIAKTVAQFLADLPGPVKEIGIQAGIAALVLPRLTSAATGVMGAFTVASAKTKQFAAEMTYAETRAQRTAVVMQRMGGAAKAAAGVGGMVALVQGSQMADGAMKDLVTTAGAVSTGFLVGGPVGGAVFGLGTLLTGLQRKTEKATRAAEVATTPWQNYADTLDRVSGAVTRATRAQTIQWLQDKDLLSTAKELGVSEQTLVNGILGREKAQDRLLPKLEKQIELAKLQADIDGAQREVLKDQGFTDERIAKMEQEAQKRLANLEAIREEMGAIDQSQEKKREEIRLLAKIPKKVVTKFENLGLEPSRKQIKDLARQYDLTPKKVRTALELSGVDTSDKRIKGIIKELKTADNTKVTLKGWVGGIDTATKKGARYSESESKLIIKKLESIKKAHPDLAPYVDDVRKGVVNATGEASKSTQVGNQLKQGLLNGMHGTGAALSAIMSGAVRDAIAAAKREAAVKSPSRKTAAIGRDLGLGFVIGLARQKAKISKTGRSIILGLIKGFDNGTKGVDKFLSRLTKKINKALDKRYDGKQLNRMTREWAKWLKKADNALVKNSKAQDRNTEKIKEARQALKDLIKERKDYAANVAKAVLSTGNITGLGKNEDGSTSITALLDQLRDRVAAAKRYASLIRSLTSQGLNQTSIQQLIDAGVEGGLATAEALAYGGKAAIAEVNSMTADLAATGVALGNSTASTMYDAGVKAAQGLVKGLEKEGKALDKAAKKLAKKLAKAVRKALGIKSPSRVFRGIGTDVTKGLVIGLDDYRVKKAGEALATSLTKGFGTPALDAYGAAVSSSSQTKIAVSLTSEQVSALQRGREIQMDLDAFRAAGGRARAS